MGKPTQEYINWKHRVNALANSHPKEPADKVVVRIIERAIELAKEKQ